MAGCSPFMYLEIECVMESNTFRGSPYGVVTNVLDCDIVESKFKIQLHYYIHFWTNALGKGRNFFISQVMC